MTKWLLLLSIILFGCGQTIYDWGDYESSIYRLNHMPADFNFAGEIDLLTTEVNQTVMERKLVPPGKYMYIGYLHSLNNDTQTAFKYFELEKSTFPESAVFIDGVIKRAKQGTN